MLLKSLYSAIGLALVLVAWSFASPVGSSADELSHLQRIYCYTDQDACPTTVNPAIIPTQLVIGISDCWKIPRFQIVSKCEAEAASQSYIRIERPYTGKDHQVFYKAMSYFYSDNLPLSVAFMRLFNSFLMTAVAFYCCLLLRSKYKFDTNILILLIPNVSFFIASINPTSWSIIALYGLTCSLISLHHVKATLANCALAAFSLALSFFGRLDTKYWSFLVLFLAFILLIGRGSYFSKFVGYSSVTISTGFLIIIFWQSIWRFQLKSFSDLESLNPLTLILNNLQKSPQFLGHIISSDSGAYASSYLAKPFVIALNCLILYLLVKSIQYSSVAIRALITFAIGIILFLVNGFHFIWGLSIFDSIHPRYFLPILVVFFILIGIESNLQLSKHSLNLLAISALLFVFLSLHTTLRRWSVGLFEFQKSGEYQYWTNYQTNEVLLNKENWVVLYEDNWIQHLKDLLFFNPKWSPMIMGGNWTVLMIGVIGCLMLICSMQRRDSSLQITF